MANICSLEAYRSQPILYIAVISVIAIYISFNDVNDDGTDDGLLRTFVTILGVALEPVIRCCLNGLQELFFVRCVNRNESFQFECFAPLKASWIKITLALVIDLLAIAGYCIRCETQPFTPSNGMLLLRVITIGTFFKMLIISLNKQPVNTEPEKPMFEIMYLICWSYFKRFIKILEKFSESDVLTEAPVQEDSMVMRLGLKVIILLVSPYKIDENLHRLDNLIDKNVIEVEGFPVYSWLYKGKYQSYVVLRAEKPREMINMICSSERFNMFSMDDENYQMGMFFETIKKDFLNKNLISLKYCVPILVDKVEENMDEGWLVKRIMDGISQRGRSPDHQSTQYIPHSETDELMNDSSSGIRQRFASQIQSNSRRNVAPNEGDRSSQGTLAQVCVESEGTSTQKDTDSQGILNSYENVTSTREERGKEPKNNSKRQYMPKSKGQTTQNTKRVSSTGQRTYPKDASPPVVLIPSAASAALNYVNHSEGNPNETTQLIDRNDSYTAIDTKNDFNYPQGVLSEKSCLENIDGKLPVQGKNTQVGYEVRPMKETKLVVRKNTSQTSTSSKSTIIEIPDSTFNTGHFSSLNKDPHFKTAPALDRNVLRMHKESKEPKNFNK